MKYAIALLLALALSAHAQVPTAETKQDKDRRECRQAPVVMKSPGDDLKKAKRDAFNRCMEARRRATVKSR